MEDNNHQPSAPPNTTAPSGSLKLPNVVIISPSAPLGWVAGGWSDFKKAWKPCLIYGVVMAIVSAILAISLIFSGHSDWIMVLAGGFFLLAPMLAMGLYEAGRQIEAGRKPQFSQMAFVKGAFRQDLAYLGLALLLMYFFWGRMAQLVYALSTYRKHDDVMQFLSFMLTTPEGHNMAIAGTIVGGIIAFIAYMLVVISAPMLLDRKTDVFIATVTSVRSVAKNPLPMFIWALLITSLTTLGIITGFLGLVIIFPVIGLASWRAYRELVPTGHFIEDAQTIKN